MIDHIFCHTEGKGHLPNTRSQKPESHLKYWTYAEEVSDQDDANEKEPALGKGKRIKKKQNQRW